MTHSGGKPHTNVGDGGQRYEVRATGYPKAEKSRIGWATTLEGAEEMAAAIRLHPSCTRTEIFDRQEEKTIEPELIHCCATCLWSVTRLSNPDERLCADRCQPVAAFDYCGTWELNRELGVAQ